MTPSPGIHYDPRLIEEAVFHAQRDSYVSRELEDARVRIYEITDADEREMRFNDLNRSWFVRLGLGETIERALQEQSILNREIAEGFIVRATQTKEEGAELFVAHSGQPDKPDRRTLRVLLRPESLLDGNILKTFLRHEFFHIADMLEPQFGYEPTLPKAEGGPTYDTLITNRYRVLWDITIYGRMVRRNWCDVAIRPQQMLDFAHAFPMSQDGLEELFAKFFDSEQPKHQDLAAFAFDPREASGNLLKHSAPGTHCPLCRFPTHAFEADPSKLGSELLQAIAQDFPNWQPALGLCTQCADLYRAAQLSLAAAKQLPGWNAGATAD